MEKETENLIIYLHGGGFIGGSTLQCHKMNRNLSKNTNTTVFAIDYRKSPEDPYPAALNDAYQAYKYIINNSLK